MVSRMKYYVLTVCIAVSVCCVPAIAKDVPSLLEDEKQAILYGYMPRDWFVRMWKAKLVEVIDKYQPDLMWFDSWLHEIPDEYKTKFLAYYFNSADKWGTAPVLPRH